MIIVTGATGHLGSRIVDRLLTRVPADRVAVSVRDPARAAGLAERGVAVRRGDYTDPASLVEAYAGGDQVLIVSADTTGEAALTRHRAAIDAAVAAGARRVLYTSHQASAPDSAFGPARDHAATEDHLAASGVAFTSLRNGFYANTVPHLLGDALRTGRLVAPADGPVSWTTRDDLAEAAAVVLAEEGTLDGLAAPLTAAEAVDLADVAATLSELSGRRIERVVVEDEEWVQGLVAAGAPEAAGRMLLQLFRAARAAEFDVVDPTLERLVGHRPTPVREVLAEVVSPT